jgi:MFS family permease
LYIGAIIGPMGGFGIVTLLPVIAEIWSIEFGTASLAITFYMIPFIFIQIFSGSIAQLYNVRHTLFLGFALYALGGCMCGLSPNLWLLLGGRVIQGLGAGFLTPIIMALLGELVHEKHVGKAIGLLGVAYTVGVTLGPLISGLIEVRYGWQWFFFFLSAISVTAALLYGISSPSTPRDKDSNARFLDIVPILKKALIQSGVVCLSFSAFCLFIAYIGIMTFTADHLKNHAHLASDQIGTLLSITGFSGVVVSPVAGYFGDRFGRMKVFTAGVTIAFGAISAMVLIHYSYSNYVLLFLILGTGTASAWTSLNTMAVQISSALRKPVTSVYNAVKFSGYALSPIVLSLFYKPFQLRAVQLGCLAALAVSFFLALLANGGSGQNHRDI